MYVSLADCYCISTLSFKTTQICENGLISFEDCKGFCKNQTDLRASSGPVIAGIWQDIILFDFHSSGGNFKVPYAYYKERTNNNENSGCFVESKEKIEQHLQRGFGERLSYFNLTHMLISTWHAIDNTNGTVSYIRKGNLTVNMKAKFGTTQYRTQ